MSLDSAFVLHLRSQHPFVDLVGGRIAPLMQATQSPLPYLVYGEIAYDPQHYMRGAAALARTVYQCDIYATTHPQARAIALAFELAVDGFRGEIDGEDIRSIMLLGRHFGIDDDLLGGQDQYTRVSMDLEIWHVRAVPTFA